MPNSEGRLIADTITSGRVHPLRQRFAISDRNERQLDYEELVIRENELEALHRELDRCRACPNVVGPVVHGPAVRSRIFLVGQAPGPHEGKIGRPFAWTAGKTLFAWFQSALGVDEETFRRKVYMAAVLRCFPGKSKGGGDRRPAPDEIERCQSFLEREVRILKPRLILPVGTLAIEQVLGHAGPLSKIVGVQWRVRYHGVDADVICLPHPSGASPWHKLEPGKTLLRKSLALIAAHPEARRTILKPSPPAKFSSNA